MAWPHLRMLAVFRLSIRNSRHTGQFTLSDSWMHLCAPCMDKGRQATQVEQ